MNLGTVFKTEEDFKSYMNWIKEQGYSREDSFKEETVKEFIDVYYADTEGLTN